MNEDQSDVQEQHDLSLLRQQIETGFDIERFKLTPVGKYFQARAREDMIDALEKLKYVDPTDVRQITHLQSVIHTAESFFVWMQEAIDTGRGAMAVFEIVSSDPADAA